jgi:hypothetical protein
MPIELSERLSEYSYGYGVTREVEDALGSVGLQTVPFLPNLIHEAKLGFDVGFDLGETFSRQGTALMLQFKLGQSLKRFVRKAPSLIKPPLRRPFWRFNIDTAEPDGQFELLLKAEQDGAEVYYAAPRFTDWSHYLEIFKTKSVVDSSLLIRPSDIRSQLAATGQADGAHRIVYDHVGVYVCSSPAEIREVDLEDLVSTTSERARRGVPLGAVVRRLYEGLDKRDEVRRPIEPKPKRGPDDSDYERNIEAYSPGQLRPVVAGDRPSEPYLQRRRENALAQFRARSESEEAALAAVFATEAWAAGAQLILVTPKE